MEQACFVLSQVEYPDLIVTDYTSKIDALAEEARNRIAGIEGEKPVVRSINHFLFKEVGFRGNKESYYDPENSYINRVLDRQLGIPISLSALYLFIAKRLELPIYGVGFPGHFLLKYKHKSGFYIDAFNNGRILTRADCVNYLHRQGYAFYDAYLSISTSKEILARMIRNLVLIYHQSNEGKKIETLERIFSDFFMQEQ